MFSLHIIMNLCYTTANNMNGHIPYSIFQGIYGAN